MRYLIISLLLLICTLNELHAQLYELGFHVGFVQSNLKPQEGQLNDAIFVREGRSKPGFAIGMQYSYGQARSQNRPGWDPRYWLLVESSFGRTAGNFSTAIALPNGKRSLLNLNFTYYRFDLAPKFVLGSKKIRFYIGPVVTRIIYAGVRIDQESSVTSATNDYRGLSVGYEGGVGLAFKKLQVSIRNLRYVTNYGKSFNGIALPIKNNDVRIFLAYTLKEKHKGTYWESIDWD